MTSNLGSDYILEGGDKAHESVMNELRHTFKPELINRIDEIIIFRSLGKEVVYEILDKIITEIEARLKDKNFHIRLTDTAKSFIIQEAYDENFGARPIKRYVQRNVESLIAKEIILDKIKVNGTIYIDVDDRKLYIKESK